MWFYLHVVVLTPAYMLALKRPHILWSIGRSVDRGVVIKPALIFPLLAETGTKYVIQLNISCLLILEPIMSN